jgi:hypothetical protein
MEPNNDLIFELQEKRTLSLLVENCGRVHYGKALDKQRKGAHLFCLYYSTVAETDNNVLIFSFDAFLLSVLYFRSRR